MIENIYIPELGEGDIEGTVIAIEPSVGDEISAGDTLLEIETDKVVLEVPSNINGKIVELNIKVGDKVKAGIECAKIESTNSNETQKEEAVTDDKAEDKIADKAESSPEGEQESISAIEASVSTPAIGAVSNNSNASPATTIVPTGPAARRLARELGLDITVVKGSGAKGRISKDDIKIHAKQMLTTNSDGATAPTLPAIEQYGASRREKLSGIEAATRDNMQRSWSQIPHAWLQEEIDITDLEAARQRFKQKQIANNTPAPLTVTAIVCKALAICLQEFPKFNAVLDNASNELIYREYINVGVAVDTPRGLLVPVIRDVDQINTLEIARVLSDFGEKARAGKLAMKDLQGGGITLSNLGGIGVSNMFPVVNWPEVAIIGLASNRLQAVAREDGIHSRLIMPTTIAFDHRVINGADGARFLQRLKELLEDPMALFLSC